MCQSFSLILQAVRRICSLAPGRSFLEPLRGQPFNFSGGEGDDVLKNKFPGSNFR